MHLESWTLSPQAMRDWAATAPAGAELVYAHLWFLPKHSAAATHARKLEAEKFVALIQRRKTGEMTSYVMQRLRVRRASIGQPLKAAAPVLSGNMSRVLRILRDCARRAQPCPTNKDLARRARVTNASYELQKLVDAGVITSQIVDAATGARVITIMGGAQTAWPVGVARS